MEATQIPDHAADVIVVGAGIAGVSCAIEAAEHGARVLVIDAAEAVGGTASGAGGGTCIAASPLQEREGIADSVDLALEDWIRWGGESVDVEWAERYLAASRPLLYDGLAAAGVRWLSVHPHEGNSVPRWHRPEGGGRRVMSLLEARARALPGISWALGTRARELVTTAVAVTGIRVSTGGRESELSAPRVVLATGGFNSSAELVAEHAVEAAGAERVLLGGGPGARGDGIGMLEAVGARFAQLDAVWMYPYGTPDPLDPDGARGLAVRGVDGELWINDDGARFHNELLRGGATGTRALLAQPHGRAWSVFDARIAAGLILADPHYLRGATPIRERIDEFLSTSPFVVSAPAVAELAARIGVDAGALRAAVDDRNAALAAGLAEDPDVGGSIDGLPAVTEAPFFALRLHPMARKNLGGVRTDHDCRVLGDGGLPIDGLFAAGEVAGMAGGRINGTAALEGTAFGPSMFSGIVAGGAVLR